MNEKLIFIMFVTCIALNINSMDPEITHLDNIPSGPPLIGKTLRNANAANARTHYSKIAAQARDAGNVEIAAQADAYIVLLDEALGFSNANADSAKILKFARRSPNHAKAILHVYENDSTFNSEGIRQLNELAGFE